MAKLDANLRRDITWRDPQVFYLEQITGKAMYRDPERDFDHLTDPVYVAWAKQHRRMAARDRDMGDAVKWRTWWVACPTCGETWESLKATYAPGGGRAYPLFQWCYTCNKPFRPDEAAG